MSNIEFPHVPSYGGEIDADGVRKNFEEIQRAMSDITSHNIEQGSIFTRHIGTDTLKWKQDQQIVNASSYADNGSSGIPLTLVSPTPLQCEVGRSILAMAHIPFAQNSWNAGAGVTPVHGTCTLVLEADTGGGGSYNIVDTKEITLGTEVGVPAASAYIGKTYIQMFAIFTATEDTHNIRVRATAAVNYNFSNDKRITSMVLNS
jgi:hypothetical protein